MYLKSSLKFANWFLPFWQEEVTKGSWTETLEEITRIFFHKSWDEFFSTWHDAFKLVNKGKIPVSPTPPATFLDSCRHVWSIRRSPTEECLWEFIRGGNVQKVQLSKGDFLATASLLFSSEWSPGKFFF